MAHVTTDDYSTTFVGLCCLSEGAWNNITREFIRIPERTTEKVS